MSEKEREKNSHIDTTKSDENKYLIQKDLKELYQEEFGLVLEKYNTKQKRKDRKIDDYFEHIKASKKTALQQEMIVQIGDKDDFIKSPNYKEYANDILEKWVEGFEKRNPQLKVYNAVIHNDEASPHLHINFVPVAEDYKRGLEKQVSFDRAIIQQDSKLDKTRPFDDWREKEVNELEKSLSEFGLKRKIVGKNEFKDVNEYKEKKDLQREIGQLNKEISSKKNELLALNRQIPDDVEVKAKRQSKMVEVPIGEKGFWGQEKTKKEKQYTGNVIVSEKDYQKLIDGAKGNKRLKTSVETYLKTDLGQANQILGKENRLLHKANGNLEDKLKLAQATNETLERKNRRLEETVNELKTEIKSLYQNTKDLLIEHTNDFKGALRRFADKLVGKHPKSEFGRIHEDNEQKQKKNFSLDGLKELDQQAKREQRKQKSQSYDMER